MKLYKHFYGETKEDNQMKRLKERIRYKITSTRITIYSKWMQFKYNLMERGII